MKFRIPLFVLPLFAAFSFCENRSKNISAHDVTAEAGIKVNTVVTGYEIIWGMDWLPNGDLLFTEKQGKMYRLSSGKTTELIGVPKVNTNGQGGLLDIKVHPDYARNNWIYATYAANDNQGHGRTTLIRFKLSGNSLSSVETLLQASTPDLWSGHYGSRIAFDKAGMLYVSIGEGGPTSYGGAGSPNMNAQNVNVEWGKVHRLTADGKVPADNPVFPGKAGPTTVYSYGHRNPQGLAYNPFTDEIWEDEHGPRGGDEVNVIQKGKNYGWPLVSFGINYDGKPVTDKPTRSGIEAPIHTWTPSIAPCGMAFITSDKYPGWKGDLLVGSLAFRYLARVKLDGHKVLGEAKMLTDIGRVRNVKLGPDGLIYVSVEGPGRILQLQPQGR